MSDSLTCYNHTASRRAREVVGGSNALTRWFPSDLTQLACGLGTLVGLVSLRGVWMPVLPKTLDALVMLGAPWGAWKAAGRWRPEDRGPLAWATGLASYALRSRNGKVEGVRLGGRKRMSGSFFVARGS